MLNKSAVTPATNHQPPTTIYIVGPTASGKSGLAMQVANLINGEIICADSQTIKKYLDIGTAKPTKSDQHKVKHHLIDIVEPYEEFSVAKFKQLAESAMKDIRSRNHIPIVVGGSGLYIDALLYDFEFRPTTINLERQVLNNKTVSELQEMIKSRGLDLPKNELNPRHLIRVIESEGNTPQKADIKPGSIIIGLKLDKEELENRITKRVNKMFEEGFVEEVRTLIKRFGRVPNNFDSIGYLIVQRQLDGEITELEAKELLIIAHRQYAKKQRSWFRRNSDIMWFHSANDAFEHTKKLF
ncbi:MAG: tRNA (adenosine(37)-N6)-dimethylallyltransferase MiaA [Candidatus Saccharibacteria bacterium]|nr:tRNA (adenosine(37)-N6)-dimethylallyltransferase MiaA [Candidatus Saccharibacteria bacterium]